MVNNGAINAITFTNNGIFSNNAAVAQTTVNNSANLTNNGAITAAVVNTGVIDNSALITGAINNSGTINSVADNLDGVITNTGTLNVNGGATLAPGNSIDTLNITGDLNLASGSTTAIEINETPASDKIVVSGATNIASGANLTVENENGRYFEWKTFDILESAGNVTGTYTYDGTITNYDMSRIEAVLDYSDPTKVVLTAKRKATDYEGVAGGLPRNANQSAMAIDAVSTGIGGDITNALLQLEKLGGLNPDNVTLINPDSTLLSALNDVHGVLYANAALVPFFNAKTVHVYDRIAKRNPSKGKCPTCHDNLWAEYYSGYDKVNANNNSPRFTNNTAGVLAGYGRSSDEVLLGVYAGFGKSDLRQKSDKMNIEDTTLGIYGGYMKGDWMFKGTLFGGFQHYHGYRDIAFMGRLAEGRYDGVNVGLDVEASYNIPVFSWLNLKPFAGWLNNYSHQQSFVETGADSLNLHVASNRQFNSQARLGVRLDGKVGNRFGWYGSAAVKQFIGGDFAKVRMNLGLANTDMEIISNELGRTSFDSQLGANYAFTDNWSIFANADLGVGRRSFNYYGNLGLAYTW
ncbi:MAG: autotransporter domain-containing protein [Elusimicrobiaceae bacterium]|nr:autotransporter domain-containing protein [Elusimicrobiaceae bacterium]